MEIVHEWQNGPELLKISGFEQADCMTELSWMLPILDKPEDTGSASDEDGTLKKDNRGVFFDKIYTPEFASASPSCSLCENIIQACKSMQYTPNSAFCALYNLEGFSPLFSAYRNGDYYKEHRDNAKLTLLVWVGEHEFSGGDLHLPDFNYTVPFKSGTALIFPSHYRHEVTRVESSSDGYVRFAVSAFIN